jgi:hypothetical protein
MVRRFINFIKWDYNNVKDAVKWLSNNRIPTWAIIIYYSIFAVILLPWYFPVKWIVDKQTKKFLDKISKES